MNKGYFYFMVFVTVFFLSLLMSLGAYGLTKSGLPKELSSESGKCIGCHSSTTPAIYQQWGKSRHYRANVGCYECHQAKKGAKGGFEHYGFFISVIVSPLDCSRCHPEETAEFESSHHAKAAHILGSMDNILADVVEGDNGMKTPAYPEGTSAAGVNGCSQCHGSVVKIDPDGKLDPATWPNSGIGRINPDGSEGSCTACHQRHEFSVAQARRPAACGRCHQGPDHPQYEIFSLSQHGIAYRANRDKMNFASSKWIAGEDYSAAPTCATCHMSATKDMAVTHNVGLRIEWNNRPPVSVLANLTDRQWNLPSAAITGDMREKNMRDVCYACHNVNFVDNFYIQYRAELTLYNDKFGKPGLKLYRAATEVLKATEGSEYAQFANKIDYTWFQLWHHEGRRARHAASMMGPDYTQWHGNYLLARDFYTEYVPEIREVIKNGKKSGNPKAEKLAAELDTMLTEVLNSPDHRWSIGKESPAAKAERMRRIEEFKRRYEHK
ncbi:MAG: multiheme c-type cytochrome [Nitrospiraceae bacterium]|nr:multiheme c-type cytochrome [Nitrospiraceae bacterium]